MPGGRIFDERNSRRLTLSCATNLLNIICNHNATKPPPDGRRQCSRSNRCDEEAYRRLMRAYAAQGRRSEALRQYQQCQKVLGEELGVQPMPETQKLFHLLVNGEDCSSLLLA